MGDYLSQTGGTIAAATGDLTDAIGNDLLAMLCPDGAGGISQVKVTSVIARAESRINVAVAPIYTVPLDDPTPIIGVAIDLFVYYAYSNRPEFATRDGKNPADARFVDAKEVLKAFMQGKPPLTTPSTTSTQYVGTLVESDTVRGWDDETSCADDFDGCG